ncbi:MULTISPECIES: sirohydrochlorin chelatase [Clostridia]|uniref:sirohydrochlorin chelatase n=1 Tax=Clostridia TaxID=186801 RepID=UPI000EA23D7E|nr:MULTISPECIES: sirohydrochlorin chelatase [Clostridia]NBJ69835.1 sirohydrochlorin chelatase [Roseburia sp. 1XD42-34]RKI77906.1 sirohydrochlorin chelatase [Clostridium sp. 1xD42-85]
MQGVLYVSHGSRYADATAEATAFLEVVKEQVNVPVQEICFLELASPTMKQGIANLVAQGATSIAIIPVLLLQAGHYYHDIPQVIAQQKALYPAVSFSYGQPLGVQDRIIQILAERIDEAIPEKSPDMKILLIGRGSSNLQTVIDIETIVCKLKRITTLHYIEACYLAACEPSFDKKLQATITEKNSQIVLVPYIWFTGFLMRHIHKKVTEFRGIEKEIVVCQHLGQHSVMHEALKDRVIEAIS